MSSPIDVPGAAKRNPLVHEHGRIVFAYLSPREPGDGSPNTPIALRRDDAEALLAMPRHPGPWLRVRTTTGQWLQMRPAACSADCFCALEWRPL